MTKLSKTQVTVGVMKANAGKPMDEVIKLIAEANSVTLIRARGAYRWVINKGLVDAVTEPKKTKEVPAKKLLKEVGAKLEKPKKNRFTGNIKSTEPKTEDEVSRIKAANLARMKEITARNAIDRKSTRLNSSHVSESRMPSSA